MTEEFIAQNLMGPNSVLILQELLPSLELTPGMRILDLGCGTGLTSFYLAEQFDVRVYAVDLWVSASENWARARQLGLTDRVTPIHADAHQLPFAEGFFDLALSIDGYHYFGSSENYLYQYFAPLVRPGGQLAIAVPGLSAELEGAVPPELAPFWCPEMNTFHSHAWWRRLWERSGLLRDIESRSLACHDAAWRSWLTCGNPHALEDIPFYEADVHQRLATAAVTARKK